MVEIENGSIIEIIHDDKAYKYVVLGTHANGITILPLENYKNNILKDFKYILFIFLSEVKVSGKIKREDFDTVLVKAKFFVPYLRQLKYVNVKMYDMDEKWNLDYENTKVFLVDNTISYWHKVESDSEIQELGNRYNKIISIKR